MSDFNIISNSEFMVEKIKERPINRKKLIRKTVITVTMAIIFGLVACFTILLLEPVISDYLYPEAEPEEITFLEDEEEMKPEDMLEEEKKETIIQIIETQPVNPQLDQDQVDEILDAVTLDKSHYIQLYEVMNDYVKELEKYMVTVTGVKEDYDWLKNSYESTSDTYGVIIKKINNDILILTEYSTIKKADSIQVTFENGKEKNGALIGEHKELDLAVISVNQEEYGTPEEVELLSEAPMGSTRVFIKTGEPVVALGSPMGVMNSIGYGMVTACTEDTRMVDYSYDIVMTDIFGSQFAKGILFNMGGEIIGVIAPKKFGADMTNMVSAYGISDLRLMITALSSGKKVPYLGIKGSDITQSTAEDGQMPVGLYITDVVMNSPAMLGGLQKGDIIIGLNDLTIEDDADFASAMYNHFSEGDNVKIKLMRSSQDTYKEMTIDVVLKGAE